MKCEYCGSKIDDDSVFCLSCGKKVKEKATPIEKDKVESVPSQDGFSGLAIASLVTGILGLAIIPIILGAVDLSRIKNGIASPRGKVFDIVGVVLGALAIIGWIVAVIVIVIAASTFLGY